MKRSQVVVPWPQGLHLRAAARLVIIARKFRSNISLRNGSSVASLKNILSVIALTAFTGSLLEIEATGPDEQEAVSAMESEFSRSETDSSSFN